MWKNKKSIILTKLLIGLLTVTTTVYAQIIPSSSNISYQLNPNSDLHLRHKIISKSDNFLIILEIETKNTITSDSLEYEYAYTNNLNIPIYNFSLLNLAEFELSVLANKKIYAFESTQIKTNFLILKIKNKNTNSYYIYIINAKIFSDFFIRKTNFPFPLLVNFSSVNIPIKLEKADASPAKFKLQFYRKKFPPSLPPMANIKNRDILGNADEEFILPTDSILLPITEGTYSILETEKKTFYYFFRISTPKHPKIVSIDKIINASIFLFTKKEYNKMSNLDNPKKEYDIFWLKNTGSPEKAKKMISAYFKRVKESNLLFSTFKEGWKTDMGMIYIIFGFPNKVFRSNENIKWVYEKTYELPTLQFTFYLVSKNLSSEYFELERNLEYKNSWFRAIDLWRKGEKKL